MPSTPYQYSGFKIMAGNSYLEMLKYAQRKLRRRCPRRETSWHAGGKRSIGCD